MIGIYKITNPNNRVYVGQSQNINSRERNYKKLDCKKQPKLYRSLKKYGYDLHIFEIIEECLFEELNIKERYWQEYYKVLSSKGMNCYLTETNVLPRKLSQETKDKISKSMIGKKNNYKGGIRKKQVKVISNKTKIKKKRILKEGYRYPNGRLKYYKNKILICNIRKYKLILNFETGIYYKNATEASKCYPNIKKSTLMGYLRGHSPNKTNLAYV